MSDHIEWGSCVTTPADSAINSWYRCNNCLQSRMWTTKSMAEDRKSKELFYAKHEKCEPLPPCGHSETTVRKAIASASVERKRCLSAAMKVANAAAKESESCCNSYRKSVLLGEYRAALAIASAISGEKVEPKMIGDFA